MGNSVSIILVSYNSQDIILQSLKDLVKDSGVEVILVDNASSDDTCEKVETNFPSVKIIKSNQNLGYGRAMNLGIKSAIKSDYIMILNPDVITKIEDVIKLRDIAEGLDNLGCIAPEINSKENILESIEEVKWVSGAAIMFKREVFETIGYFDENIFLYYEEDDLLKRISNARFRIFKTREVLMPHLVGKSSSYNPKIEYLKYWHSSWSKFYFVKKHDSKKFYFISVTCFFKNLLKYLLYVVSFNAKKKVKYLARVAGQIAFLSGKQAFNEDGEPRGLRG